MSKNRKAQSAAIRFGPAIKAVVLCLLIGGSGVGYVWQKDQIVRLGRQIKNREVRLNQLEDLNEKARKQLATMRTTGFLEYRVQELKLGLGPPQPGQVMRLTEPAADTTPPLLGRQYAAHQTPAVFGP